MTITFKTDDGREIVFTDAQIYEADYRPASGQRNTEVTVVFFTNEYEKACNLAQLDDTPPLFPPDVVCTQCGKILVRGGVALTNMTVVVEQPKARLANEEVTLPPKPVYYCDGCKPKAEDCWDWDDIPSAGAAGYVADARDGFLEDEK